MPKVTHVAHCRAPTQCSKCGVKIKKGDPYLWWKFNYGARYDRCLKCPPEPSELTRSPYQGQIADLHKKGFTGCKDLSALKERRDELVDEIRTIGQECQEKYDRMPPGLKEGSTGELLQERATVCESLVSEMEGVDIPEEEEDQELAENQREAVLDELQTLLDHLS